MPFGYNGKVLHIDLSQKDWQVEEPEETWFRTYLGGSGAAAYYLLKQAGSADDPLSPENPLVFAVSVVTGAPLSGFSRYTVAARSPLTGFFGESEAGGFFGPELKSAGYDVIVIRGRAARPVYLWIHEGEVEIRDASRVWGRDNAQTSDAIKAELGDPKVRIASIGQAR